VEEVHEHLEQWSAQRRLDPDALRAVWKNDIAPLLGCVDVPTRLTTVAEQQRLDYLGQLSETTGYGLEPRGRSPTGGPT